MHLKVNNLTFIMTTIKNWGTSAWVYMGRVFEAAKIKITVRKTKNYIKRYKVFRKAWWHGSYNKKLTTLNVVMHADIKKALFKTLICTMN